MPLCSGLVSNRHAMPSAGSEHDRLRPQPYFSSAHGSVYYSPRNNLERSHRPAATAAPGAPRFPTPLIQPRQRRPHSIHIVSYPAGFVPHDLRSSPRQPPKKRSPAKEKRDQKNQKKKEREARKADEQAKREKSEKRRSVRSLASLRSLPPGGEKVGKVLDKLFAAFSTSSSSKSPPAVSTAPTPTTQSRPTSFISFARRLSRFEPSAIEQDLVVEEPVLVIANPQQPTMATAVQQRPLVASATNAPHSVISIRSGKNVVNSSITEVQKPVASGSGLSCSILLAEPNVFLTGFDHDGGTRHQSQNATALLRGKLQLKVSKNVKIKSVTLRLVGKARTEWPEGIPPTKVDMSEEQTLRTQSLVFFQAMHEGMWETEYGSQCTFTLTKPSSSHHYNIRNSLYSNYTNYSNSSLNRARNSGNLTAKELKRLSLQSVQSRSFGKGDSALPNQVQAKGYKVFGPGTYEYTFELPIDHHQLETTKLQYGSVKWELETTVERAGAFKPNLHGTKEVSVVRLPDQMSLEMTEPISISRQWEDQLHYDIMISGKSFPIGAKIPIAFKLTPLAKVQVHKLKVFVTESVEYWTNDRRVTRKDVGRKILLLEKTAGKPLDKLYEASDIRVLSGGELDPEQREEARQCAAARRTAEASRVNCVPPPLPAPSDNLLGDLDLGLESFWGSTEIEMNVQIPTCQMMARDKQLRLHPDCSWKNVNVYHWIKIVMRISRADPEDPMGKRRRHFEISIDSPFTVLNCRATQANTLLPQYSGRDSSTASDRHQMSCGCPDAQIIDKSPSSSAYHLPLVEQDIATPSRSRLGIDRVNTSALPVLPQAAHMQDSARVSGITSDNRPRGQTLPNPVERDRPIHLLRHPSFNPPAFDAEEPPPPLMDILTPPPNYDAIVGTPSVDGLADYFARLAVYEHPGVVAALQASDEAESRSSGASIVADSGDYFPNQSDIFSSAPHTPSGDSAADDDDSSDSADEDPARPHRGGRVNVANPRTPGGRLIPSRSLEIERPVMRLDMAGIARR
ncbi:hypothetical protein B0T22DRAFT_312219 [Podospora appendiculata]|uniref:Arrestin C-terminal-like domain-containing protein n=1 Tax=Podospora appendiculata TaxID=314037 RepID=A0AAE1C787_9PEZI|nr:hypothetical protein B0T22DRAFT_312219 [Podospora appendiculata]